jgi:hypothetical protein
MKNSAHSAQELLAFTLQMKSDRATDAVIGRFSHEAIRCSKTLLAEIAANVPSRAGGFG